MKTTIGKKLAERLQIDFFDADDFHPKQNIEKMHQGIPLTDADRYPWLETMRNLFETWDREGAVLACSALKNAYRVFLADHPSSIEYIYLDGNYHLIVERMKRRNGHFMKAAMLQSQFDTLEIPEYGFHISIDQSPDEIVEEIIKKINNG